jgi:hypothetical protein
MTIGDMRCLKTSVTKNPTALRLNRPGESGDFDVPRVRWCRHTWFQATGWAV